MKKTRKIDEIYREKLTPVETPPPADVWENISSRLPEKKKKNRVLPLWYKIGGAAAALALLFGFFNNYFSDNPQIVSSPVKTQQEKTLFDFDITSTAYEENMSKSFMILERLMLEAETRNRNMNVQDENPAKPRSAENLVPEIEDEPEIKKESDIKSLLAERQETKIDPMTGIESQQEEEKLKENMLAEVNAVEENTGEEALKEETVEEAGLFSRFSITPTAAAVYFDHIGSGNILGEELNTNPGGGEISMSYGLVVDYRLSEKVKIRSGINKVDLAYNTKNVDYAIAVKSEAVSGSANEIGPPPDFSVIGLLNQEFSFIEIPMEIEYTLLNQKFGINFIGGTSAYFLKGNDISLKTVNYTTSLGEATNLNKMSFSANIGFGFHYDLSSQFQLNLEPILKYQINTFGTPGMNSYYFGIYSGLSYKF